jgi:hypothetical protein
MTGLVRALAARQLKLGNSKRKTIRGPFASLRITRVWASCEDRSTTRKRGGLKGKGGGGAGEG